MRIKKRNRVIFQSIKGSTITKFLIIDCIICTGIYYAINLFTSSVLIGIAGSLIGTEGIKKVSVKLCK
ncbi:hypothetical protein WQ54_15980 [Bacillus sp. SA1-12]|uniref:hypothetical protein n=1 Tax=Bacillus sp. SA1-12 TaxID=1455638 RepID=UPI000626FB9C|nr:hypothetical protein [Bacillus sp. SA1-12]KKI91219.1 hypothetical protein WQ54_15980 [Bacillus sp. SA1-12]